MLKSKDWFMVGMGYSFWKAKTQAKTKSHPKQHGMGVGDSRSLNKELSNSLT